MSDAISDCLSVSSPEQDTTKSQLLSLKEKIDEIVQEYNKAGIPEIPKKLRKDLKDRLTSTWVLSARRVPSTQWRNQRAQDVYLQVLNACPHLYIAFISVIAPTACFQPNLGRIVAELLQLNKETPVRLKLNSEAKEFFTSIAVAGAFTEDPRYINLICSLFPEEPPSPTETPDPNHSHSSVYGSSDTGQTSPKISQHSVAQYTDSFGSERSVAVQSLALWVQQGSTISTAQPAFHTAPALLENVQDISAVVQAVSKQYKALDFQQRAVTTFEGAIYFAAESIPGSKEREAWISSCLNHLRLLKRLISINESNRSGRKRKREASQEGASDGRNGVIRARSVETTVAPAAANLQAGNASSLDPSLSQTSIGLIHDQGGASGEPSPEDANFSVVPQAQATRQVEASETNIAIMADVDKLETTLGGYLFKGINASRMRKGEKDGGMMTLTDTVRLHVAYQEGEDFKLEVWLCSSIGKAISQAKMRSIEDLRSMLGDYLFEAMDASNWRKEEKRKEGERKEEKREGMSECTGAVDVSFPNGNDGSDCKVEVMLNFGTGTGVLAEIYPRVG
ncbi:hypothetical protein BDZ45DRAFT_486564 [Acephala macrosclerotiorum]|nr:hypothetical protein BDZ45DRAFT_486564 [Acephala macrosclerotiorum]